jgi:hypothetical protein
VRRSSQVLHLCKFDIGALLAGGSSEHSRRRGIKLERLYALIEIQPLREKSRQSGVKSASYAQQL